MPEKYPKQPGALFFSWLQWSEKITRLITGVFWAHQSQQSGSPKLQRLFRMGATQYLHKVRQQRCFTRGLRWTIWGVQQYLNDLYITWISHKPEVITLWHQPIEMDDFKDKSLKLAMLYPSNMAYSYPCITALVLGRVTKENRGDMNLVA